MRSQAALRMECGSLLPLLLPDAGLLQRRKLGGCLKTVYGAGFQPFLVRAWLPGASPQADMDRAYGAFRIIISQQLKRQRRDAMVRTGHMGNRITRAHR